MRDAKNSRITHHASKFQRRRHERRLNTINENPQISPMTQIFLCTFAPLRLCVKLFSEEL